MNLQENRCSSKKVNALANRSVVDVSCDFDAKRVAKLNDCTKNKMKAFFLKSAPSCIGIGGT